MSNPEIWKPVQSSPGILASSRGRVMIAPYAGEMPHGGQRQYGGYARCGSWDGTRFILVWKKKTYRVHRLVCEAFNGPPPFPKAVCMHVDENPRNNDPQNLRWGTQKENLNAPGFIAYCKARLGENSPYAKGRRRKEHAIGRWKYRRRVAA